MRNLIATVFFRYGKKVKTKDDFISTKKRLMIHYHLDTYTTEKNAGFELRYSWAQQGQKAMIDRNLSALWAAVSGSLALLCRRPIGLAAYARTAHQPKLNSDKFGNCATGQTSYRLNHGVL